MATTKRTARKEPLLSTVARKLGHAAGTLTKATHDLTENLSSLENVTTRLREVTHIGEPAKRSQARPRRSRKGIRRAPGMKARSRATRVAKTKSPGVKSRRNRRKSAG